MLTNSHGYLNLNFPLIIQSIPSLLISLIGLCLAGNVLDKSQFLDVAKYYPILLISNCILSFKGNTELIFAMHLSTLSQVSGLKLKKYLRFSIDNGCLVFAQSIIIGLTVGLLGMAKNIFSGHFIADILFRIITISTVASITSSIIVMLILIPSTIMAVKVGINPDNIVLPVISAFGDFVVVKLIIFFLNLFVNLSMSKCTILMFLILAILPIPVYISAISKRRVPLQSLSILMITYGLSTTSGYSVQYFSKKHPVLAPATPIFCGLSGSISYIYLNKKMTAIANQVRFNRKKIFVSLVLISIITSFLAICLNPIFGLKYKPSFSALFIILFVFDVCILLQIVDGIMLYFSRRNKEVGVFTLPLMTSISDIVGTLLLLFIAITTADVK